MSSQNPCDHFQVTAADGARIVACAHGGHILGWTPAGGEERLWLSRNAECGPGKAIRGGIPVIWPQFSDRGTGPRHGIARNRAWTIERAEVDETGAAKVVMALEASDATRAILPLEFRLELVARASGGQLDVTLSVENLGPEALSFAAALHAYLRVSDGEAARLDGLAGSVGEDNASARAALLVPEGSLKATDARDWAIKAQRQDILLSEPSLPPLSIAAEGFEDRVVWNPGPDSVPGDVHPGGVREFVCIEPAALTPILLAPAGRWLGTHRLRERKLFDTHVDRVFAWKAGRDMY